MKKKTKIPRETEKKQKEFFVKTVNLVDQPEQNHKTQGARMKNSNNFQNLSTARESLKFRELFDMILVPDLNG